MATKGKAGHASSTKKSGGETMRDTEAGMQAVVLLDSFDQQLDPLATEVALVRPTE